MKDLLGAGALLSFALALVACGGGGSGGTPNMLVAAAPGAGGSGGGTASVSQVFQASTPTASTDADPSEIVVRFDPPSIAMTIPVDTPEAPTLSISATASNLPSGPVSVFLVDESGILKPEAHPLYGAGANTFATVAPNLPTLNLPLSVGVHEGVLKIMFCTDSGCATRYPVSASSVLPYSVTVTQAQMAAAKPAQALAPMR